MYIISGHLFYVGRYFDIPKYMKFKFFFVPEQQQKINNANAKY